MANITFEEVDLLPLRDLENMVRGYVPPLEGMTLAQLEEERRKWLSLRAHSVGDLSLVQLDYHKKQVNFERNFFTQVAQLAGISVAEAEDFCRAVPYDELAGIENTKGSLHREIKNQIYSYGGDYEGKHLKRLSVFINGVFYGGIFVYYGTISQEVLDNYASALIDDQSNNLPGKVYLGMIHIVKSWAGIFAERIWKGRFPKLNSLLLPEIETIARNVGAEEIYVNPYSQQRDLLEKYYGFVFVSSNLKYEDMGAYLFFMKDSHGPSWCRKQLAGYEGI